MIMHGNLEPEERVLSKTSWLSQLATKFEELNWNGENLEVVIAGTQVYEIDGDGSKWSPSKGTQKYDKDAFIIIRQPQPATTTENNSVTPHHSQTTTENSNDNTLTT